MFGQADAWTAPAFSILRQDRPAAAGGTTLTEGQGAAATGPEPWRQSQEHPVSTVAPKNDDGTDT